MAHISKEEHAQFLEDCRNMSIYLNYLHHQFKTAESYNHELLKKYHKAYVTLVSSYGNYSGSALRIYIKSIIDSTRTAEEKFIEYISCLNENIEKYNTANASRPKRQIRLNK